MQDKIIEILQRVTLNINIDSNTELIFSGILTSMNMLNLLDELSKEFNVIIGPERLEPENFENVKAIESMINNINKNC